MNQYEMLELSFQGEAPFKNEAMASPESEFTLNGKRKKVMGFYAGDGTYKVRFYPQETGVLSWKVKEFLTDGDRQIKLSGTLEGSMECKEAAAGNVHGMVRVNGLHFAYDDGTPYQAFGTTIYALIHQEEQLIDQTFDTLSKAPFNKVRFCVFPKHYDYNHNEPDYFAFEKSGEKFDVTRPCFPFWDALEKRIEQLDKLGIQGDLILFHPYDRWGFAELTFEECMTYLSYLVRRLAAFPNLWWSLANEYDLMGRFKREWWEEFAQFMGENDPYGHLLSNHNCLPYWDFSNPYTTHCSIQDTCVNRVGAIQRQTGKPVVFDEVCYEGNIEYVWGNISAFEMVNRFWTAHILGGYCTHGETFLNEDGILWWSKGGILHGESPARIAFLRKIMEELPTDPQVIPGHWNQMEPEEVRNLPEEARRENPWLDGMAAMPLERIYRFIDREDTLLSHCGQDVYLRYYGRQCSAKGMLELPEDGRYIIEVIDVWEMTRECVCTEAHGRTEFMLPGKEGIAVIARKM